MLPRTAELPFDSENGSVVSRHIVSVARVVAMWTWIALDSHVQHSFLALNLSLDLDLPLSVLSIIVAGQSPSVSIRTRRHCS